jgi:hypothetical protein
MPQSEKDMYSFEDLLGVMLVTHLAENGFMKTDRLISAASLISQSLTDNAIQQQRNKWEAFTPKQRENIMNSISFETYNNITDIEFTD